MNGIINDLENQSTQLSFANDLLQIFLAFAEEECPMSEKPGQAEALFYANHSKTYITAVSVAAEKLVSVINALDAMAEEVGRMKTA